MLKLRTILLALVAAALVLGTANAAGVAFDSSGFDPYDDDEGYVDFVRDGDMLTVTFSTTEGAIPATMEGDFMPLDSDVDEYRLNNVDALALYGGLPYSTTPTTVLMDVSGDTDAILAAALDRLSALGLTAQEDYVGGPVRSYTLTDGDAMWRIAITIQSDGAMIHLQGF